VTPRRLSELEKGERRRAWLRTGAVLTLAWLALIAAYYLVPAGLVPARHRGADAFLHLGVGTALFAAILAWQARRIVGAELPELRAVEALGVVIPLFLILFATFYLSMSNASARPFSQHLDHTEAIYFTITVFSTVGFGDITPHTDLARIVVSIQMLLDLVIIGAVVRMLLNAAQAGLARAGDSSDRS
jgi:voltage-gated potassium channel